MISWAREMLTVGIFYIPFIAFIGFGLFVLMIGISTLITGTIVFLLLGTYGLYAVLRDTGLIEYAIERAKGVFEWLDVDILENINKSFVLKNAENIPQEPALILCHPHGIMGLNWFYHFCHPFQPWAHPCKRPYIAVHYLFFKIPILKELLTSLRCIDSSDETIRSYLEKGESVVLLTGGVEEMIYTEENVMNIIMKKRKGYSRIAKQTRVPIVIFMNTNENKYFPQNNFFLWKWFIRTMHHYTRITFPLPSWKAITSWASILKKPLKEPITTFVLKPIETLDKSMEAIQKECIARMEHFIKEKHLEATILA